MHILLTQFCYSMSQCLVGAGLADYARPADKLSVTQSGALAATGEKFTMFSYNGAIIQNSAF